MTGGLPADRVAALLGASGYRTVASPLQIAGLTFEVAGAFVGNRSFCRPCRHRGHGR